MSTIATDLIYRKLHVENIHNIWWQKFTKKKHYFHDIVDYVNSALNAVSQSTLWTS